MISESEALERILGRVSAGSPVNLPLLEAQGFFAAGEVMAGVPVPGFDNSAMDGYAVRFADVRKGASLRVSGVQPAGRNLGLSLGEGEAIRIFTGAPMPEGADTVLMQEDTSRPDPEGERVVIEIDDAWRGEFVRRRGADLCQGQTILRRSDRLHSSRIGLLASQGLGAVEVIRPPRVTVISTGDELVAPGEELREGEIYNSNGPMLAAMVRECGIAEARVLHLRDDPEEMTEILGREIKEGGFLIISGGVSVGERDFVKEVLESRGVETGFWRVRVKPGKPLLFGHTGDNETLVFGLPGNPVSSFVTFCLFVRPALMKSLGAARPSWEMPSCSATSIAALENRGDRPHYFRGTLTSGEKSEPLAGHGPSQAAASHGETRSPGFRPAALQESHGLGSLATSNALLRVDPRSRIEEGETVTVRCPFWNESF